MKVIYDKETDTLSIIFSEAKVADSDEIREGLILDYDKAGCLVSLELLDASEQIRQPESVEFALASVNAPSLVREKPTKKYGG
jgi:uncharacterized protein YuzE